MKCTKRRCRDRLGALMALANTQRSRSSRREECRAYHCPDCHGWHLTSKARRKGKA